jgi:PAS domain S-box-containing protein
MRKALKENEKRLSRLSELTYEGIIIHKNGIVVDLNPAFSRISGYSENELKGSNIIRKFIPKEYHSSVKKMMASDWVAPYEIKGIRKDGKLILIEIESRSIDINEEEGYRVTAIRDISQRVEAKNALSKSEEINKSITETAPNAIILINSKGLVTLWNKVAENMFGYSSEEMEGKGIDKVVPSINLKAYKEDIENIEEGKNKDVIKKTVELIAVKKSEESFPVELSLSSWSTNGEVFFTGIIRDISDRKKTESEIIKAKEKAENADKMKSIFLAQMSHEIRTPINALVSMSSLLRYDFEEKANEDQLMSFDVIDRAGERIIRTIDLLINLSEIQAGTYEVHRTQFNLLSDVISVIIADYKRQAKNKGINLLLNSTSINTEIISDSYTVTQIFTQLIDNAIKYTNKGEVSVKITRNEFEQLVVEIKDTGIGIEEKYLTKIFEAFSQEEMGYTRKYEGNGIGLTLVKTYCKLNNAKIEVESKKGIGSTFRVLFS